MKLIVLFVLLGLGLSCAVAQSSIKSKKGWIVLFDGKTTNGWHQYGKKDGKAWEVSDSALHLKPAAKNGYQTEGGGDLITNTEYDNFDLKLEWKISKGGNSGIIFYVQEDPSRYQETWKTGLEMQVLDNDGHPDGMIYKHRAGDLYDLIPSIKETVRRVGEWNEVEIKCKNGDLELYLNSAKVVSVNLWNDKWKQLVAGSKFKVYPDFGTFKKGRIALQDHGNEVWYRNIRIRKL